MVGAILISLHAATPVAATVFEYDQAGAIKIDGKRQTTRQQVPEHDPRRDRVTTSSKSYGSYSELAQDIAFRHAGGPGPRAAGLDALTFSRLFTELVRAESAFNPRALSPKGAQGLGQLMPATARRLGVTDPWDPAQNLNGAARYLCAQLERFGDAHLALAAYNAGPHRVVQYGGVPPFRETRAYVAKISAAVGLGPTADQAPSASPATQSTSDSSQGNTSVWNY